MIVIGKNTTNADELSEKKSSRFYVPRDECFSEIKQLTFSAKTLYSVLKVLVPSLGKTIDEGLGFPYFTAIDSLFTQGVDLVSEENQQGFLEAIMPRLVKSITDKGGAVLHFETPDTMSSEKTSLSLFEGLRQKLNCSILYI